MLKQERIQRWRRAAKAVGASGLEVLKDFQTSRIILPLTTNTKKNAFPIRVPIPKGTCGIKVNSDALVDQMLAWDISLFKEDKGELPEGLQEILRAAIADFLDL